MRRLVAVGLLAAVAAGGASAAVGAPGSTHARGGALAAAAAPRVQVMVAGQTRTLLAPKLVTARARTVTVGRRRCAVAAGTALSALEGARRAGGPGYRLRDYGTCTRRAQDAASLFVFQIGGEANRGRDGWVYKIGRRVPSAAAGDPDGTRLRSGDHLFWFFCRMQRSGGCQRTLEVAVPARAGPGAPVRALVRAYDDDGRGAPAAGATVTLGATAGTTGPDGTVTLAAPAAAGRYPVRAQRAGLVPAFPVEVRVG